MRGREEFGREFRTAAGHRRDLVRRRKRASLNVMPDDLGEKLLDVSVHRQCFPTAGPSGPAGEPAT